MKNTVLHHCWLKGHRPQSCVYPSHWSLPEALVPHAEGQAALTTWSPKPDRPLSATSKRGTSMEQRDQAMAERHCGSWPSKNLLSSQKTLKKMQVQRFKSLCSLYEQSNWPGHQGYGKIHQISERCHFKKRNVCPSEVQWWSLQVCPVKQWDGCRADGPKTVLKVCSNKESNMKFKARCRLSSHTYSDI